MADDEVDTHAGQTPGVLPDADVPLPAEPVRPDWLPDDIELNAPAFDGHTNEPPNPPTEVIDVSELATGLE